MRGESHSSTGGDQASRDTLAQAWADFRQAFERGIPPGSLATDASQYPGTLFDRTVKDAIVNRGFAWKKGEPKTDFALSVVEKIAARSKSEAGNSPVKREVLIKCEKEMIRIYREQCPAKVVDKKRDAIFCVLYDADGNYTGP